MPMDNFRVRIHHDNLSVFMIYAGMISVVVQQYAPFYLLLPCLLRPTMTLSH